MPNWNDVLIEITNHPLPIDTVRRKYLEKLNQKTKRNIIAYYSGFLSKPGIYQSMINDEDKNGIMMAVHRLDRSKGLDLILHTEGGDIAATESIVNYLHKMFNGDIRAIIPQIAMSAGTMLACSCKSILMGKQSNLGPIDPHIRGIPAHGVIEEFKRAYEEIKREPQKATVWGHILSKYNPAFLSQCEHAITWSEGFVLNQLQNVMFKNDVKAEEKAKKIIEGLSYYTYKTHNQHVHIERCKEIGLKVEDMETGQELQDLVLTSHHCFMYGLMNTPAYKIIENHIGTTFVKQDTSKQRI